MTQLNGKYREKSAHIRLCPIVVTAAQDAACTQMFRVFLKKLGESRSLFGLFSPFSRYNFNNTNWKKRRWCSWDSNPGLQDGRCRRNHRAMVVARLMFVQCWVRNHWTVPAPKINILWSISDIAVVLIFQVCCFSASSPSTLLTSVTRLGDFWKFWKLPK